MSDYFATQKDKYLFSFYFCTGICILLQWLSRSKAKKSGGEGKHVGFSTFQYNYLLVFLLAMFADWLQGPYVYELYVSYGFTQEQIAELFVCGFGSSMIVGTFVGSLADKWGRKLMCMMYGILYIAACVTKLFPNYWILMFGRFLSGISTSLLFSVFESWMVCEHFKKGFDSSSLSDTFSYATFGNGLVAVIAGLVSNYVANTYGYVAPFVVAMMPLSLVGVIVLLTWNENYGNQKVTDLSSFKQSLNYIVSDTRIAALGLAQSLFEGSMYTFVFMWTPALKSVEETKAELEGEELADSTSDHLGLIFAVFMVNVMIGSSIFKMLSARKDMLYFIPLIVHATACLAMFIVANFMSYKPVVYVMFLLFECSVGMFYPAYGVIKSEKVPEDIRSSMMNIFR